MLERLAAGSPVVLDGAMNTELSQKGYLFNSANWLRANIDAPHCIAAVHADYARSGAEVHIANSFATALHVLEHFGLEKEFETLNRAAVNLCRDATAEAASHHQWVAGSISTFAHDHDRRNLPSAGKLESNVARQAEVLASAGCDLIALEMLYDVEKTGAMLNAAARAGLPISVGFVCETNTHGDVSLRTLRVPGAIDAEANFAQALVQVLDAYIGASELIVTVMHCDIEHTAPALKAIRKHWSGAMAAYPNNGRYSPPGKWDTSEGFSSHELADACENWLVDGVSMVGGCCGVGPDHIAAVSERLGRVSRRDPDQ